MANNIPVGQRLKMASKELAMGNIGNAALSLYNPYLVSSTYRGSAGSGGGFWMDFNTSRETWYNFSDLSSALTAYTRCAPVAAIVNKKAQAHLTGIQTVVNTQGKAKGKEATGEFATKLKALLKRPNKLQTWNEFEAQVKIYQQVFGYTILLPIAPIGFPAIYATSIWVIPPHICSIIEKPSLFLSEDTGTLIQSITLTYGREVVQLDPESVYIIKDITPSFTSFVLPDSRIKALAQPINNIIGAYNARGGLIDDRGALGMISSDKSDDSGRIPMKDHEKEEVQKDFQKYGIKKGQFKYIITTAALKWTSIGFSTKELMLFEEVEDDIDRIHDAYGTNKRLFNNNRNNSLGGSDAEVYDKQFYQNTIIPESDSLYDQFNNIFGTEQFNIKLFNGFGHLAVLQADAVKTAQAGALLSKGLETDFKNNIITVNEWRIAKGYEPLPPELGDVYYSDIKHLIGQPINSIGADPNPIEDPAKLLQL